MKRLLFAVLLGSSVMQPALSAESPKDVALAHVRSIAAGNTAQLTNYRADAFLWWVGGPLDGTYAGDRIGEVWRKFAVAGRKLDANVASMNTYANPKGATVVVDVTYASPYGAPSPFMVHVLQTLLVRDGMIQDEIWQVVPQS